jgi:hypothetical protein
MSEPAPPKFTPEEEVAILRDYDLLNARRSSTPTQVDGIVLGEFWGHNPI